MQAALPDVNMLIQESNVAIDRALVAGNLKAAGSVLHRMTYLIDPAYRPIFDSHMYHETTKPMRYYVCRKCQGRVEVTTPVRTRVLERTTDRFLAGRPTTIKFVKCEEGHEIRINGYEKIITVKPPEDEPLKYLPEEPRIRNIYDDCTMAPSYKKWISVVHSAIYGILQWERVSYSAQGKGDEPQ